MKKLKTILLVAGVYGRLVSERRAKLAAQGRNFDPAQMRQDMLDNYKTQLDVKDDAEWKLIEAALGKVMDAQREVMSGRIRGMMSTRGNRGGTNSNNGSSNRQRGGFGGTPSPEAEDFEEGDW